MDWDFSLSGEFNPVLEKLVPQDCLLLYEPLPFLCKLDWEVVRDALTVG